MSNEATAAPTLIVETGVHRGARAALAPGISHVGGAPENDIVVSDLQSLGACFVLDCRPHELVLRAVDLPLTLANGKPLRPGQSRSLAANTRFRSGGIAFRVEAGHLTSHLPNHLAWRERLGRAPLKTVIAGTASIAALLAVLVALHAAPSSTPLPSNASPLETTGSIAAKAGRDASGSSDRTSLALRSLRQHLDDKGLDAVVLTARSDGAIEARGQILSPQKAAWQEVGRWFDGQAGGRVVLVDGVSVSAEEQPLALQSVWPGPNPYVIDGNGGKLFVGSVLASGWTISSIDRTRVLMRRGDQTIAVKF
jgi:hypothetical protein